MIAITHPVTPEQLLEAVAGELRIPRRDIAVPAGAGAWAAAREARALVAILIRLHCRLASDAAVARLLGEPKYGALVEDRDKLASRLGRPKHVLTIGERAMLDLMDAVGAAVRDAGIDKRKSNRAAAAEIKAAKRAVAAPAKERV